MVDGTGTTAYDYNAITVPPALGAGRLAFITNPATLGSSVISYQYDVCLAAPRIAPLMAWP